MASRADGVSDQLQEVWSLYLMELMIVFESKQQKSPISTFSELSVEFETNVWNAMTVKYETSYDDNIHDLGHI